MYEYDDEGDEYTPPVPKLRANAKVGRDVTYERKTQVVPIVKPRKHYLFYVGIGMALFLAGWMVVTMIIEPWISGIEIQWHYGDQHVSLFGADVGHGGVSRFISFEQGQEIVIVEVVQKRYAVYSIPVSGPENRIVTLSVRDVNGDGKLDLVVHLDGVDGDFALINNGSAFSWNGK
jgi:hypothetical protein